MWGDLVLKTAKNVVDALDLNLLFTCALRYKVAIYQFQMRDIQGRPLNTVVEYRKIQYFM